MSTSADTGGNLTVGVGQIESDPAVLKLTAFETFFDENRPFFVEGQQYYQFDVSGGDLSYTPHWIQEPNFSIYGFQGAAYVPNGTVLQNFPPGGHNGGGKCL